ncbi:MULTISPECIES: winged helix DNA-binding protein [unclassified Streptomyces]|uniref:MarR family winged helix-turn-helix transcriptional regulator n=1 Tax=unclassified Streptomyces TaxID=2593676 RepID=UPI001BAEB91A|nr:MULTISPECIES: winged helix DNA-binding protein [unclassified Streptomyces]MDH6454868.1 DNA-binding MarR family transcriptional regulator [Streptomyces sp. SAI-119]MDH6494578.1 DNA-binding MarR family transcriptional regulator [Streptomyces sp. SAI-149]QUC58286.1 winged helix DNA-binding protein [Streptomyces sp. A2-16]
MTTTAPPVLNPRVIALAHYAARALLESVLARHGMTFHQSVTLRVVAVGDGATETKNLVDGVVGSLKIDAAEARSVVDELIAAGLLAPDGPSLVRITDAGRQLFETTSAETAPFTARVYAGIPAEDLAVAGRVLSLITERADAELAALKK